MLVTDEPNGHGSQFGFPADFFGVRQSGEIARQFCTGAHGSGVATHPNVSAHNQANRVGRVAAVDSRLSRRQMPEADVAECNVEGL